MDGDRLKLCITFSSVIGRSGLPGEAHYGLANEWLSQVTEQFQHRYPHCRTLAVEWSIWSGIGMGERLGRVDTLMRQGITPISPDAGLQLLHQLGTHPPETPAVLVTGRLGSLPTLQIDRPDLPLGRFLEQPRIVYPGIELVVDAELSVGSDPYLDDHVYQGELIVPAVMGMEAMAQVAIALTGSSYPPTFHSLEFSRPIVVPSDSRLGLRIAALKRRSGLVDVVLRTSATDFQVDHFRCQCSFESPRHCPVRFGSLTAVETNITIPVRTDRQSSENRQSYEEHLLPLDPNRDLYGSLLFHRGRFQRLQHYRLLKAKECFADIESANQAKWFGDYLPDTLLLGDPGIRDASIHALQACIPHTTLLPIAIEHLQIFSPLHSGRASVSAKERLRDGDTFIYDLEILDATGAICERWQGLTLKAIAPTGLPSAWPSPLVGPYLERNLEELLSSRSVAVVFDKTGDRRQQPKSDRVLQYALGHPATVVRRPDGKPEVVGDARGISAAHTGTYTLAVAGHEPVSCDAERIQGRSRQVWRDLLGGERISLAETIASEAKESFDAAASRVWTALECLKKTGESCAQPMSLSSVQADRWVLLQAGKLAIATVIVRIQGEELDTVFAVLVQGDGANV